MYFCQCSREALIACLPKGGRVAEIGVAEGDFSCVLLEQARPSELHLVDPWVHQQDEDYRADVNNVASSVQETRYQKVLSRFEAERNQGTVVVHRAFSQEAASTFPEGFFDWIFLDARRTRDAVAADLRLWAPKIKPDGFLLGHDYADHAWAKAMNFGVIEAVNDFVVEEKWAFLALTNEGYPTYMLTRNPASSISVQVLKAMLLEFPVIDIRNFQETLSFHVSLLSIEGKTIVLPSV